LYSDRLSPRTKSNGGIPATVRGSHRLGINQSFGSSSLGSGILWGSLARTGIEAKSGGFLEKGPPLLPLP
ncbi:MAG: hypothetical protein HC767_13275, partial [Akkermansiaceae bacterium]|nr:hypothetical protein [Akkermansiaceae bacterium]